MEEGDNTSEYGKFASGVFIVGAKNANFNADFTGTPRRLPDKEGTIYATDKALKYCIRKYLNDKENARVFMWRRRKTSDDGDIKPLNIDENYNELFNDKPGKKESVLRNLLTCDDVRLFGATYAGEVNVSITGPVQLSYGVNKFKSQTYYENQILSPFRTRREEVEEEGRQTSIGREAKGLEIHYVYDFVINPNTLSKEAELIEETGEESVPPKFTEADKETFIEGLRKSVNYVNSTTKIGSEGEFLLLIEYEDPLILQNLKDFIKITKKEGKIQIDLGDLFEYINENFKEKTDNLNIEMYYPPEKVEVKNSESEDLEIHCYRLLSGKNIE